MATYTLIPSSLTGWSSGSDVANAYTDTSSSTYAEVVQNTQKNSPIYLGGFNFVGTISPLEKVTSLTVKVKAIADIYAIATFYSASGGVALSSPVDLDIGVQTFTLSASIADVVANKDTLCIRFDGQENVMATWYIYGAEIIVETAPADPVPNKIIYDGNTLIDLTSDTVTASKVRKGVTFHLPSGLQTVGALDWKTATATTSSSTARSLSFTALSNEPTYFFVICSNTDTTARSGRVMRITYDGDTTTAYYVRSSTAGSIASSTSRATFTYSSGTLAITVTTVYFGAADWELYYM